MNPIRKSVATAAVAGCMLAGGMAAPAYAQVEQDGLVNVNIGDVTVPIGIAAQIVANVCPNVSVGNVAVLARQVDRGSLEQATFCEAEGEDVVITQNA